MEFASRGFRFEVELLYHRNKILEKRKEAGEMNFLSCLSRRPSTYWRTQTHALP